MKLPVTAVLCLCAALASGCGRRESAPTAGAEAEPAPREWPQGRSAPLKVTDQLILAIPLQYELSALHHGQATHALMFTQSDRTEVQFDFFLPDFTGYTLGNYQNEFDEHKVEVVYLHAGDPHEAEPDAPGEFPPNMLKRALQDLFNPDDHQDLYGLRCYRGRGLTDRMACYGRRDATSRQDILLYVAVPPYAPGAFPVMQARYFTRGFGGVRIAWRTHVSNLPRWHDIDTGIWRLIDEWNVAPAVAPAAP
jgi:hypothetical protein